MNPEKKFEPIIEFLLGSGEFESQWFGEVPDGEPKFWWRDKLREYAAKHEAKPDSGWIPVSERLPEVGQRVLTYTCESPMTNEDQRVIVYGSIAFGFPAGVTHWQPLPEAPTTNP